MAINLNETIVYQDLYQSVINSIISAGQNIDSWKNVPSQMKPGWARTINGTVWIDQKWDGRGPQVTSHNAPTSIILTLNGDSYLKIVPSSTVRKQFDDFLASRGIVYKKDTIMTMRAILNFIVNASAFIRAKMVNVVMSDIDTVCTFYYEGGNDFATATPENNSPQDVGKYCVEQLNSFNNALTHTNKLHVAKYNIAVNCCSSCSSSSSSSCSSSSSSSSSSSVFLAYMKI